MNSQNNNHDVWLYSLGWYDGREIGKLCLDWGVILHGLKINGWESTSNYFSEIQVGDFVVMRWWIDEKQKEYRVGQVVGTHEWHDEFRNIDGWDLSRVRRVRWLRNEGDFDRLFSIVEKIDETNTLLTSINNSIASEINEELKHKDLHYKSKSLLEQLPTPTKNIDNVCKKITECTEDDEMKHLYPDDYLGDIYEKVSTFLDKNPICLPEKSVEGSLNSRLKDQLGKMTELLRWHELNWYSNPDAYLSEHETVCHFVVPLLMALGWNQKQIAVEWNIPHKSGRIDIALFQDPNDKPRQVGSDSLLVIVEVKQLGKALLPAYSQAKGYWEEIGIHPSNGKRIIVTDGRRYIVYKNTKGEFEICAYMDLARPRDKYPVCYYYHKCEEGPQEACEKGFKEALLAMLPNGCP